MAAKVLLVDDDADALALLEHELMRAGFETLTAIDGRQALEIARAEAPRAVVLDLVLPDVHGRDVLAQLRVELPDVAVVVLTADDALEQVVECMRLGAVDYVRKPFDGTRLVTSVRNACTQAELRVRVSTLAHELRRRDGFEAMIGDSRAMRRTLDLLTRAARSDVTVLLHGESGTGKEVAARALHAESVRRAGPFVAVNLGAIPETLLEGTLFGHERGAFTGATASRVGAFEMADGGTVFLDEVGELRTDLQVRLLRVLQERSIQRVGSSRERPLDVRVVAATNRDLAQAVASGSFREDLYYRIAVFPIPLPPLREREGDLLLLADACLHRYAQRHARRSVGLTAEARRALVGYPWPGNVRELENVLERAVILEDGDEISLASLPDAVVACLDETSDAPPPRERPRDDTDPGIEPFELQERAIILRALERTGWNPREAAARLEIGRATIYRKIERYGLKRPDPR